MLLQKLKDYSERLDMPPTLYGEGPLRYIVELDEDGRLLTPKLTDLADPSSPVTKNGQRRQLPQIQRSVGIKPLLLADKADYALGFVGPGGKPDRVAECHSAFLELATKCAAATGAAEVAAVVRFLETLDETSLALDEGFNPGGVITFRVAGVMPIDLQPVQRFWADTNDPGANDAPRLQCLICGNERPVLDRLQGKLKGVPGGQTAGTAIISANAGAFESYGLEASLIAPTCADCGERFTKAANALLQDRQHRLVMGGAAFLFWTQVETGFDFYGSLDDPQPEQVRELLDSVRSGRRLPEVDASKFYATVLSGSGGRAVVREWIDIPVGEAKERLAEWFSRQQIVDPYGQPGSPLGIYALAAATVRDARKDLAPPTPRSLLRAALTGTPVPPNLLHATVLRCQVREQQGNVRREQVTRQQAALVKLALTFLHPYHPEEDPLTALDPTNPSIGYRCGRLLAVLEQAQRNAIPGVNQTIVDRFYGTASTSPRSVFPRLMQGVQPHIAKLRRDRRGTAEGLNRRIEEIAAGIPSFPSVLNLEEQGMFALGFYHQRGDDRLRAAEGRARREAAESGDQRDDDHDNTTPEVN